jgi:predicted HTH transcriptional regulator
MKEYKEIDARDLEAKIRAYQSDLRKVLSSELDPNVEIQIEPLELSNHRLIGVHVSQGDDRPYQILANNDIYIRRGANNFRPTRDELRNLVERNQDGVVNSG